MNIHVLICVAYISGLCDCAGGAFRGNSQPGAPGNKVTTATPVRNSGAPEGLTKPPASSVPNRGRTTSPGQQIRTTGGTTGKTSTTPLAIGQPPKAQVDVPKVSTDGLTVPNGRTRAGSTTSLGSAGEGGLSRSSSEASLNSTESSDDDSTSLEGLDPLGGQAGSNAVQAIGTAFSPNDGTRPHLRTPGDARVGQNVPQQNVAQNVVTLTPQSAFTNKDFLANGSHSVATENDAPYEELADEEDLQKELRDVVPDEVVIQEEDLQEEAEDVIQEVDLMQEDPKGQTNRVVEEAARISQELAQRNAATLSLQNGLEAFVDRDISPRKPLRDIEVHEESEVTKGPTKNAATLKQNNAFINKDISLTSRPTKVLQDTEVIEEPLPKGTNLNGQGTDSAWDLTNTSHINKDIKRVQTTGPMSKLTNAQTGTGGSYNTTRAVTAAAALGGLANKVR